MASNECDGNLSTSDCSASSADTEEEIDDCVTDQPPMSGSVSAQSADQPTATDSDQTLSAEDIEQLKKDARRLQCELDEARSLVAVANYSLEESLETERRKCKEEVATLQQLMKENLQVAVQQAQGQCEGEIRRLKNIVTRLELELHELRASDKDNPNVFSAVTKTLARKVGNLTNPSHSVLSPMAQPLLQPQPVPQQQLDTSSDDYMEQSMKRAQEDVEVLRSLVLPLEEEIKALKDKLRTADDQLRVYETSQAELIRGTQLLAKLAEDHSISSIMTELYSKNKEFWAGIDQSSQAELYVAIVNAERTFLNDDRERLRSQLQEACQLLESERRQHRELRRSLQKSGDAHVTQSLNLSQELSWDKSAIKAIPIKDKLNLSPLFSRISPNLKRKSPTHSPQRESVHDSSLESSGHFVDSQGSGSSGAVKISTLDVSNEDLPTTDSQKEKNALLNDFLTGQTTASWAERGCEQCAHHESDIQQLRDDKFQLEKQLGKAREEVDRMSELVKDMEHKWTEVAKDYEKQVTTLYGNIEELVAKLKATHSAFNKFRNEAQETLRQMQFDRESIGSELVRLQEENDFLVGKHSAHAEQLQNEIINLPDNLQELQYAVLNLREDLIAAKVAKEAVDKKCHSETLFLKEQLIIEQQAKEALENSLSGEIDYLREQLGLMRSVHTQLDEESTRKASLEMTLQQVKEQLAEAQERANEAVLYKNKTEVELQQLKNRVGSLQSDLETSETVQRDFVQLSQQLQVQLEKIRQSEKELRWQYEEDVDNCAECRQVFTVTKRKHHCRHCGQIFCFDCLRKTVTSGPNKRQSRVCNVCYYLLVQDSAPFFSCEPQPASN